MGLKYGGPLNRRWASIVNGDEKAQCMSQTKAVPGCQQLTLLAALLSANQGDTWWAAVHKDLSVPEA